MTLEKIHKLSILEDRLKRLNRQYASHCRHKIVVALDTLAEDFKLFFNRKSINVTVTENNMYPKTKYLVPSLGRAKAHLEIHYPLEIYEYSFDSGNQGFDRMHLFGYLSIIFNADLKEDIYKDIWIESVKPIETMSFENLGDIDFKIKSTEKKISIIEQNLSFSNSIRFEYFLVDKNKPDWKTDFDYGRKKKIDSIDSVLNMIFD